jgi:hypothetical protein
MATGDPIHLTWRQELAASWSITWPNWIASFLVLALLPNVTLEYTLTFRAVPFLVTTFVVLFGQVVLTFRLVRKDYRSFWIGVRRERELPTRRFTLAEQGQVALQILWPQIAFLSAISLLSLWMVDHPVSAETARGLNSLAQLFRILVVGPAAIRWAMYASYSGFSLQAYRPQKSPDLY